MKSEREVIMRTTKMIKTNGVKCTVYGVVVAMLLLTGAVQAQAVNYKNSYRGVAVSRQQSAIIIQTTATAPAVGFQSTSAYSEQWSNEDITPMLNSDGSVNDEAYGVGSKNLPARPRKNPVIDPDDPGNTPLGDGLWVLLALAAGYAGARRKRILGF